MLTVTWALLGLFSAWLMRLEYRVIHSRGGHPPDPLTRGDVVLIIGAAALLGPLMCMGLFIWTIIMFFVLLAPPGWWSGEVGK